MKKRICLSLIIILLVVTIILANTQQVNAYTKNSTSKAIAIVFDNSGTMYIGNDDTRKAWCRATYAMEALATMMNPSDTMYIYPMNPIQIGNSDNPASNNIYTRHNPLIIKQGNASDIREIYTPYSGDTHIETVTMAHEGLINANADEKWLIVLTDGTVFYRNGIELTAEESVRQLTDELNTSVKSVNAMYLGIGADAKSGFAVSGNYHFVERKAITSNQVLENLTDLGNIIFGRDILPVSSETISFDISMKKLIIFIQGDSIDNVALSGANPIITNKLKYSTYGAKNYSDVFLVDATLQGTMLTFGELDAGNYTLRYSGEASDIAVYYEPNVDLDFIFTNIDGSMVNANELYEGEYKVSFGMKDAKTSKLISSELLGKPIYQGSYFINGTEYKIGYTGQSGEVPISLKMGDNFEANLTVTYLSGYTITKYSTDFGWPTGGIQVAARPAGNLKLEITGGDVTYTLQDLEIGQPYIVKIYYNGIQLTGDELRSVELKWNPDTSNALIKKEIYDDYYELTLHYKDPAAPKETICGECSVAINAFYTHEASSEAQTQALLKYNITDDFSPIKLELIAPQDYIVISKINSSNPITVNLTMNGVKLSAEEFENVKLEVESSGIEYILIPNPQNSSYEIQLISKDGINKGDYNINVNATYTDIIGRVSQSNDSTTITLSTMPLWLKWLIALAILLLLIIIIISILNIKVLPKHVFIGKNSKITVDAIDAKSSNFSAKIAKGLIVINSPYSGKTIGLSMQVKPGDDSYLRKSQANRSAELTADIQVIGAAKVTEAHIGSTTFVVNSGSRKLEFKNKNSKAVITSPTRITYKGTIQVNGVQREFSVNTVVKFVKE